MSHNNGVTQSAIHGWLKDEQKLHDSVDIVDSTDGIKRKARTANDPELDKAVNKSNDIHIGMVQLEVKI